MTISQNNWSHQSYSLCSNQMWSFVVNYVPNVTVIYLHLWWSCWIVHLPIDIVLFCIHVDCIVWQPRVDRMADVRLSLPKTYFLAFTLQVVHCFCFFGHCISYICQRHSILCMGCYYRATRKILTNQRERFPLLCCFQIDLLMQNRWCKLPKLVQRLFGTTSYATGSHSL